MVERRKWTNDNNEGGRKDRRLRNEFKRTTKKAQKEYIKSTMSRSWNFTE
jgi:hypothetical protein